MRLVLLACLFSVAAPSFAQDAPEQKAEKKICRRVEATGTILGGKRECHTKAEWRKISEATSERAGRALDDRRLGSNRPLGD